MVLYRSGMVVDSDFLFAYKVNWSARKFENMVICLSGLKDPNFHSRLELLAAGLIDFVAGSQEIETPAPCAIK